MTAPDLRQVRAIVTDANVLGRLNPAAVAAYLTRSGWIRAHERAGGAIWTRWLGDGAVKVFLPNEQAVADFALRMGALLAALAVAEDRSQLAVLVDLYEAAADHSVGAQPDSRTARRTDWMEPEYGLRRPELALVLNLAACRIERQTFVCELQRLDWPCGQADELADLVCHLLAALSAPAGHDRARQEDAESPSIALIAAERQRQVEAEGWTAKHDDRHVDAELARAAACYALPPDGGRGPFDVPTHWPFEARSWKPTPDDRVRELVKAAALIAAEIDRLLRKAVGLPAAAEVER